MSLRSSRAAVALAPFLAFLVVTAVPVPTRAQDPNARTAGTQAQVGSVTFSLGATIGQVGGTAYERVYIPERDFKLSELQWDLEDVAMAGVQVGVGFPGRFRLNLGYRAAVNEGDGDMVDRDWMLEDSVSDDEWTHESRHPDTALDSGTMLDINLDFRALSRGSFSLSGILGYRSSEWEWSARGGDYIYTWDDN
jgi:omptin